MTDDFVSLPKLTDPKPHHRLLEKYLAGECTLPERVAMERWILAHPQWTAVMGDLIVDGQVGRDLWAENEDTTVMEERVLRQIGVSVPDASGIAGRSRPAELFAEHTAESFPFPSLTDLPESRGYRPHWRSLLHLPRVTRYAIGIIVATILCLVGYTTFHNQPKSPESMYSYTTANGERAKITLPDGSTVVMNVGSRIQIPTNFTMNRTVHLNGEALFSVNPASDAPFTVISGPSTTRVLGTTFLVRYYDSDTVATVAVRDGKVSVQTTVLTAMEQISVDKKGLTEVGLADPRRFSFESGVLQFRSTSLKDALPDLNRWYNADIQLGDSSLAGQEVTGGFRSGSLTDLAAMFEWTFNLRVVRDGRTLTLYSRES